MKHIVEGVIYKVSQLNPTVRLLEIIAPKIASEAVPGQFVNVKTSAAFLRKPLGIADICVPRGSITLLYRVLGEGTKALTKLQKGDKLNLVGPLGKGFATDAKRPLIIGGGLGLAPLLFLAKFGFGNGRADLIIGGKNAQEVEFWQDLYKGNVNNIFVTTDDGSIGAKGTVMAALEPLLSKNYDCIYCCGPVPMMKAVARAALSLGLQCQVSLERYMACGLGACLSCSCANKDGKRLKVCQDGPVFWAHEVVEW